MSKPYTNVHDLNIVINDMGKLTDQELFDLHDLDRNEHGNIFDMIERITFNNIGEWATFNAENDIEQSEHYYNKDKNYQ